MTLPDEVERLSGPSREMDARIAVAIKLDARGILPDDHEYLATIRKDDECAPGTYWFCCRSGRSLRTAPAYTASLDAAMTLVPDGLFWTGQTDKDGAVMTVGKADSDARGIFYTNCHQGRGKTPAIALTAAALRARQEIGG